MGQVDTIKLVLLTYQVVKQTNQKVNLQKSSTTCVNSKLAS